MSLNWRVGEKLGQCRNRGFVTRHGKMQSQSFGIAVVPNKAGFILAPGVYHYRLHRAMPMKHARNQGRGTIMIPDGTQRKALLPAEGTITGTASNDTIQRQRLPSIKDRLLGIGRPRWHLVKTQPHYWPCAHHAAGACHAQHIMKAPRISPKPGSGPSKNYTVARSFAYLHHLVKQPSHLQ